MKLESTFCRHAIAIGAIVAVATVACPPAYADGHAVALSADEMEWVPFGDGPAEMLVLWGDMAGGEFGALIKLPPGFEAGLHSHSADYNAMNVAGNWEHTFGDGDVRVLPPNSYVMQPAGEAHNDRCLGPEECIIYLHQHAAFDYIPAEGATE